MSNSTPLKSYTTVSMTRTKQVVVDGQAAVDKIIPLLRLASNESFLDKYFPLSLLPTGVSVEAMQRVLRKQGALSDKSWRNWPGSGSAESRYYGPFTDAANAIAKCCRTLSPASRLNPDDVEGYWIDRHSKAPDSPNDDASADRPNCLYVSTHQNNEFKDIWDEIEDLRAIILADNADNADLTSKLEERETAQKELEKTLNVWWRLVHVAVEFKPEDMPEDFKKWIEDLKQLIRYLRRMLEEQLDRRFVLGLLMFRDKMIVVHLDRSGPLITAKPINIAKDPKTFIRIIAGLKCMSPDQLGWDTTMKLYKAVGEGGEYELVASYLDSEKSYHDRDPYQLHWSIEFGNGKERYVSIRVLSAVRSGEMCGRATLIFEVVKFAERMEPTETKVLKRYWRPIEESDLGSESPGTTRYPSEGQFYDMLDKDVPASAKRINDYHDVMVGGAVDSTFRLIRRGIVPLPMTSKEQGPSAGSKRSRGSKQTREETDPDAENYLELKYTTQDVDCFGKPQREKSRYVPVDRVHTEILMPTGIVVKFFCDLRELLNVFIGGIEDHLHAHKKGILHRDVSGGNLLIFPVTTWDREETVGRLMDLDHAIITDKFKPIPTRENLDNISAVRSLLKNNFNVTAMHDVLVEADRYSAPTDLYISRAAGAPVINTSELVTISRLGWDQSELPWPDFSSRIARQGERSGTLPFMSPEVLFGNFINYKGYDRQEFHHNSVHDLESFFWVLVRICLTRRGPGLGMVREELKPNSKGNPLRIIVKEYFESDEPNIKETKYQLFLKESRFEEDLIPFFDKTYFESLRPLVLKWWATLVLAYCFHGNEYYHIHSHILRLLRDSLRTLPASGQDEATAKEIRRRKKYYRHSLKIIANLHRSVEQCTPPSSPAPSEASPQYRRSVQKASTFTIHPMIIQPSFEDSETDLRPTKKRAV
ncbi:hypothetical protein D9615_007842 [Tricholomella constricta]|uniref:Protein kinase domain-containing protein n=1 Tax=Tricholomella constricta TaxID=117010 RepID=A0A8H5M0U7_9AGAR|nr:hypothetical protein D9615_007842 [Tricholomella constricta]